LQSRAEGRVTGFSAETADAAGEDGRWVGFTLENEANNEDNASLVEFVSEIKNGRVGFGVWEGEHTTVMMK